MKSINLILAATFSISVISCNQHPKQDSKPIEEVPVSVMSINKGNTPLPITASGILTTDDEVMLSFTTGGIVSSILVKEGDAVTQGQLLATLNTTEAKTREQQALLAKEMAARNFQRTANLYAEKVASLEQYQNDKTALDVATQQWKSADYDLQHTQIRAIKSGYIGKKMVEAGSLVTAGTPVVSMFGGAQSGRWIVKSQVSDLQWMNVKEGDNAEILVTNDDTPIKGQVIRKSQSAKQGSGSYSIDVLVQKTNAKQIAQGMFAKVSILSKQNAGPISSTISIPYQALLDADGRTGYVFVPAENGRAKKVKVIIEENRNNEVVISSGLEGVSKIILAGSAFLQDNSPYKVTKQIN